MPLAEAGTTAVATANATTVTTASFTPAANSLLVALVASGNGNTLASSLGAVTDSAGGTWTRKAGEASTGGGDAEVWIRDAGASPSAMTVTWDPGGAVTSGLIICVKWYSGAKAAAQQTGTSAVNAGSATPSKSIAHTVAGSLVVGSHGTASNNYTMVANANSTLIGQVNGANGDTGSLFRGTNLSGSAGSVTYGYSTTTTGAVNRMAYFEILPSTNTSTSTSFSDSVTVADAVTRGPLGMERAQDETVTVADAVSRGPLGRTRAIAEGVTLTDAASFGPMSQARTIAESVTLADAITVGGMNRLWHSFETGLATGTTVSAANSGTGGVAFTSVTIGSGAGLTYDASALRGGLSLKYTTGGTAAQSYVTWAGSTSWGVAAGRVYGRMTVAVAAAPAQTSLLRVRAGSSQAFRITVNATGMIELRNSANTAVATSSTGMTFGSSVWRIAWDVTVGASATGTVYIYRDPTSAVPDETLTASGANFGASNVDEASFGCVANVANVSIRLDDILINDVALPGPAAQTSTIAESVTVSDAVTRTGTGQTRALGQTVTVADTVKRSVARSRAIAETVTAADAVTRSAMVRARAIAESVTLADTGEQVWLPASIERYQDAYDTGGLPRAYWPGSYGDASAPAGRLRVWSRSSGGNPVYAGAVIQSPNPNGFTWLGPIVVQCWPAVQNGGTGTVQTETLMVSPTAGTDLGFLISTGAAAGAATYGYLECVSRSGYWDPDSVKIPYDPVAHLWLSVGPDGGNIVWKTSPDGVTWTTRRTLTAPAWTAGNQMKFSQSAFRDSGTDNYAEWDNLNLPPGNRIISESVTLSDAVTRTPMAQARTVAETVALADASTRSTSTTRTVADSVTVGDALGRVQARSRSVADTVTVADAAGRTSGRSRAVAETVALADASTRSTSTTRTVADTVTVVDALGRVQARSRAVAETVTVADVAARGPAGLIRAVAQAVTLADAVGTSGASTRSVAEAVSLADAVTRSALSAARMVAEAVALADAVGASGAHSRSIAESITVSSAVSRSALSMARSVAETLGLADAAGRTGMSRTRAIAESVTLADAIAGSGGGNRSVAESITLADAVSRSALGMARTVAESLALADAMTRQSSVARGVANTLTAADAAGRTLARARDVAQALTMLDAGVPAIASARGVAESMVLVDAGTALRIVAAAIAQTVTVSDGWASSRSAGRQTGEALALAQAQARTVERVKALTQSLTLADAMKGSRTVFGAWNEPVGLGDVMARAVGGARTVADPIVLAHTFVRQVVRGRGLAEAVGFAEDWLAAREIFQVSMELEIAFSETAAAKMGRARAVNNPVGLLDVPVKTVNRTRAVDQVLGLADIAARTRAMRAFADPQALTLDDLFRVQTNRSVGMALEFFLYSVAGVGDQWGIKPIPYPRIVLMTSEPVGGIAMTATPQNGVEMTKGPTL